jgi:Holliday junction DNA helicase RuvA
MIARLRGEVVERGADRLVIEAGGVGYEVWVPARTASIVSDQVVLSIYTDVREDDIVLYGFESAEERTLFTKLRQVKNIGPSKSLALLSFLTPTAVVEAIETGDARGLAKAPGIGAGTANNLIHELKGKLRGIALGATAPAVPAKTDDGFALAMAQLGYKRSEIDLAIDFLQAQGKSDAPLAERIRMSLGRLSQPR